MPGLRKDIWRQYSAGKALQALYFAFFSMNVSWLEFNVTDFELLHCTAKTSDGI